MEKTDLLFFKFIGDKTAESALAEPFWPARGTWTLERFGETHRMPWWPQMLN